MERNRSQSSHHESTPTDLPAVLGGTPVFEITPDAPYPKLDQWQQITEEEAQVVYEMTLRNELSGTSTTVQEFERIWCERHQTEFALSLTNGTAALHSAMFGLGVGPGDEVICPTYTWMGSITPALTLMATPVFCEVDPRTLLIDIADVRQRITPQTKAIVAVHLWGNVCDMDALMALSDETGIPVIEDCSHAHGASYKGLPCGSIGQVGAWSLQGNKPISGGEGGMLATNDVSVFERACLLGQVNRSPNVEGAAAEALQYTHLPPMGLGVKFRAHPLAIGIASVQLKKLDELNANRRAYIQEISDGLQDIPGVSPIETHEGTESAGFYGFPIHYYKEDMNGLPAPLFAEALRKEGVLANNNPYPLLVGDGVPLFSGSLPTNSNPYPLLHTLPLFTQGLDIYMNGRGSLCPVDAGGTFKGYTRSDFPVTEKACSQLIFLPLLTKPVAGAASRILAAIRKVSLHSHLIAAG
ncbi:DegT/DnrJ/EryC1/StrS family aminotransferase [Candidatus Poribacteria bacterium]|nr:DegT/DnrJ/EryC1/StrS family aminotransferase [Candidatus Poribacteria bacterium]MYA98919.1 DegT/DnrJ/EryC1/StrS family aminotransferase [Candidatus Poribacteria bacterium]